MSVINQMLRDLDARGQGDDAARRAALAVAGAPIRRGPWARTGALRVSWALVTLGLAVAVAVLLASRHPRVDTIEGAEAPVPTATAAAADKPQTPETPLASPADAALQSRPRPQAVSSDVASSAPALPARVTPSAPSAPRPAAVSRATPGVAAAAPEAVPDPPAPRPVRATIERVDLPPVDVLEGARSALASGDAARALVLLGAVAERGAERDALEAAALQQLGRHADAIEGYTRALRLEPDVGAWWAGLGISLDAEGRSDDALGAFREAQRRGPLDPALADYLGERVEALTAAGPPR